jgi:hypothetical protein
MTERSIKPASKEPYLFLDVDGVLNAFQFDPNLATFTDFEDHEVTVDKGNGFRMIFDLCLSRSMGRRIATLPAEIVWVTTWEHNADLKIAHLLDLPRGLMVLDMPDGAAELGAAWKLDVVSRVVTAEMRPFVWVDDDMDTFRNEKESARRWAANLPVENLLLSPDPRTGLTHGDFDAIKDFLERLNS